jgi:surface antigen
VAGIAQTAYELSLKGLEQQERVLDELRNRTGTLLAASSLVAAFLGARALDQGSRVVAALTVAALIASIGSSVYILLPKANLVFALRGTVFANSIGSEVSEDDAHRWLAAWLESYRDENQPTIDRLFWWFRIATLGVLVEIILFGLSIAIG